jgi:TonB-dependent SusC/RagA subfamily outer membrane receptor
VLENAGGNKSKKHESHRITKEYCAKQYKYQCLILIKENMNKNKTFNVKRDFLIIMAFLWLSSLPICAQNITVRGNVVDEQKEPLIGVSVKIQGTTIGTVTDYDGNFELPNVPPEGKLEFSYVGMKTLIVPVNGRTMINVTMQEDVEMLEEVVITGYGGTQLRSRSTHSIAKVENKKLEVGIFSNPGQALSGAVSGLRVVQYSGNPGATPTIVLRGGTNLDGSGSPLVIVDGQVRGSLSDINPEDIENMQVMKDAGATAIYGARANNGVILIQTKRGKKGVSEMNFKMKVGANYLNLPYEFCNAEEYLTWMRPSYVKSAQIWQRENGTWVGYSNPITLTGTQPYGTGNAYFADDGVTPLENTMNSVWSTMYY